MTTTDNPPLYESDAHLVAEKYLAAMKPEVEDFELVLLTREIIEREWLGIFLPDKGVGGKRRLLRNARWKCTVSCGAKIRENCGIRNSFACRGIS